LTFARFESPPTDHKFFTAIPSTARRGVMTKIDKNDVALVSAVGIEGKLFYCSPHAPAPKKFDKIIDAGKIYVITDAHELKVNNVTVAHSMVVKG
jgi:hypothetical protein